MVCNFEIVIFLLAVLGAGNAVEIVCAKPRICCFLLLLAIATHRSGLHFALNLIVYRASVHNSSQNKARIPEASTSGCEEDNK